MKEALNVLAKTIIELTDIEGLVFSTKSGIFTGLYVQKNDVDDPGTIIASLSALSSMVLEKLALGVFHEILVQSEKKFNLLKLLKEDCIVLARGEYDANKLDAVRRELQLKKNQILNLIS